MACVFSRLSVVCLGVGAYDLITCGGSEVLQIIDDLDIILGCFCIFVYCRIGLSNLLLLMFLGFLSLSFRTLICIAGTLVA